MPDVTIVKLKIRRGTDSQRKTITLEQGELGYATDTRRVFVGDGITVGGVPVSNINHPPIKDPNNLVTQRAVVNDFIYAGTYLYQLTASDYTSLSSWVQVSNNLVADGNSIDYTNIGGRDYLKIKNGGITGSMFNASATHSLGGLSATTMGLKANVDNSTLTVTNSNLLSVYSIDQRHISNSSFTDGITGGNGDLIRLNVDQQYFNFTEADNQLTITNIPDSSVTFSKLDTNIFGGGLIIANEQVVSQYVRGLGPGLQDDGYGNLLISDTTSPGNTFFKTVEYNSRGQILSADYSITTVLSCDSSSPELAIFNGSPSQVAFDTPYTNQTLLTALSTSPSNLLATEQVVLSSAGFICFESTNAKDGMPVGRFAIPVFTY
jgi:hypothetical protein